MAVSVSPSPSDGPLSAQSTSVNLTVQSPGSTTFTAVIRTPTGNMIPIEHALLADGTNRLVLPMPPGGVPSGSVLMLIMVEPSGTRTVVSYKLL